MGAPLLSDCGHTQAGHDEMMDVVLRTEEGAIEVTVSRAAPILAAVSSALPGVVITSPIPTSRPPA